MYKCSWTCLLPAVTEEKQQQRASSQRAISRSLNLGEVNPVLTHLWAFSVGPCFQLADDTLSKCMASPFCCAHGHEPRWHFWGVWHRGHSFVTSPSHPALPSTSGSIHTPLLLISSFWNTSFLHFGFPFLWLDSLLRNLFYLWLQLSLMHSLQAAPLTMFYCFCVLGESMGQEKDAI